MQSDAASACLLEAGAYILGREVEVFEAAFADFIGVAHALGVGSGTDVLELALHGCGIGARDLVFSVSYAVAATVAAIVSSPDPNFVAAGIPAKATARVAS